MPESTPTGCGLEKAVPLNYTRIYSDASGESHFSDECISFELIEFSPHVPPVSSSTPIPTTSAIVMSIPKGGVGDWHPAPRRLFNLILRGEVEGEVSDGQVRRFGAGDLILVEDVGGKGHVTRVMGDDDVYFVVITLAAD